MGKITEKDLEFLAQKGISSEEVEIQLSKFNEGVSFVELVAPATPENGITVYNESKQKYYEQYFDENKSEFYISSFIPASGAATRLFRDLLFFQSKFDPKKDDLKEFAKKYDRKSLIEFFKEIKKFAFYRDLKNHFKSRGILLKMLKGNEKYVRIADAILNEDGLNLKNLPKGLIPFHYYKKRYRTPVSEHMVEAARLFSGNEDLIKLHFTVSNEHLDQFNKLVEFKRAKYESDFNVKYEIEYSFQEENTDTIVVDDNNEILREEDKPLTRPGGHGSLIKNLQNVDADIVFIKNIDNVVPDFIRENTLKYRKMLGGLLMSLNNVIRSYDSRLTFGDYKPESIAFLEKFLSEKLGIQFDENYKKLDEEAKVEYLHKILKRPVRVCGVVPNQGAPGGGPFWVKSKDGSVSLQIIEHAQIDFSDKAQANIANSATHFNPVDIVCTFKDWTGEVMNLDEFIDNDQWFISKKNIHGVDIKALERPGLWNGSMAKWNTVFVEIPNLTFNPVKTINDLLNPEHQTLTEIQTTA